MAGPGGVNMEQFELFFQKADLDRDGRISGAEAVGFFQGANLTKPVLAQIWMHADQNRTGYLSRPEFYNALKLVTVAQSRRELTPDIVKAALHGQASAKIPAPQINLAAIAGPQPNAMGGAPSPQMGGPTRPTSQNLGFRGQTPPSTGVNPQFRPAPPTTMLPASSGMTQQFRQVQPSGNQQFGQFPSSNMGTNRQFGQVQPSTTGVNQQFGQVQSSSTGVNQQFGQVQSSSTGVNQQFGQVQPSTTGVNQHFGQAPSVTNTNQQFGMAPSNTTMNQQFFPSQGNQSMRPPQFMPTGAGSQPPLNAGSPNVPRAANVVGAGLANSNNDRFGGQSGPSFTGPGTQVSNRGLTPSTTSAAKDPKAFVGSGNGSPLDPMFGGDVFSANRSSSLQVSSAPQHSASNMATSSAIVPVTSAPQPTNKPDPFEVLQSTVMKPSTGGQTPQTSSLQKYNQQVPNQVASAVSSSGVPAGVGNPTTEQPQSPWPKMTRASIQKYAKVFMEVDTDRDGKITGEQARHLFLSWRLPREVLKQVWDLSDQDSDSMLSLREFCIALYLMERYREGRPLPSTLPNSVMFDETLLSLAGPPTAHGSMGWGSTAGIRPQQPLTHAGARPPMQLPQPDGSRQINQHYPSGPVIDNSNSNQLSNGQETPLETKGQEAAETNENVLLDSREKLEFYRTKMQDLVLYKSRCDNRLNEITERARADKGEAELLEKKYQEKYKQVAELHSKLTIEEHTFREIQERKTELHQAIIKMEQGGSADGILQVRADRIQSDLEELLKILTERCKKHALDIKSSAIIELPQGWQPGIQELAAIWDEDWDKFEDEGFSFDVAVPANSKTASVEKENYSPTPGFSPDSVSNADATSENLFSAGASAFDTESVYSADYSKSPRYESPSQEFSENNFRKSPDGDAETHRSFDDSTWGNFDNNDDIDSVWGFSAKESEHGKDEDKYFFGSNDFGASPERTDSPRAHGSFEKNSPFTFEDSIPETPLSRTSNSPPRYSMESKDPFSSDAFARYESFGVQDRGSSPTRANLTRFDSINSTTSYDHSRGYSFDDSDPFGSSGPFKVSSETPKKGSDSWNSF